MTKLLLFFKPMTQYTTKEVKGKRGREVISTLLLLIIEDAVLVFSLLRNLWLASQNINKKSKLVAFQRCYCVCACIYLFESNTTFIVFVSRLWSCRIKIDVILFLLFLANDINKRKLPSESWSVCRQTYKLWCWQVNWKKASASHLESTRSDGTVVLF